MLNVNVLEPCGTAVQFVQQSITLAFDFSIDDREKSS
jgi:hypothetical protein